MNNTPRDTFRGRVTWYPSRHVPTYVYVYVYSYVCSPTWHNNHRQHRTLQNYVKSLPIVASYPSPRALSSTLAVLQNSTVPTLFESLFSTRFESDFPYLIWIKFFDGIRLKFYWIDLIQGFWLDLTQFSQLYLNHIIDRIRLVVFQFDSTHV